MLVPIIAFIFSLVIIGAIHTILDPVMDGLIVSTTTSDSVTALYQFGWDYFPIFYAMAAIIVLILLAQKRNSGGGVFTR